MYHVIQVGMNSEALRQLDALRPLYPDAVNRAAILVQLILEAHANVVSIDPAASLNDNGSGLGSSVA